MSNQPNTQLAHQIYGLFNEGQVEAATNLATDDVELVLYPFGQTFQGREGFTNFMRGFLNAFPDLKIEIRNQVAGDGQIVNEITGRGTHTGPLMTPAGVIPPTGRSVELSVCEVWKVRDGKLAGLANYQDSASLMRQLGLMS